MYKQIYYDIIITESGSGIEDYTVTFPAGQISVPIEIPVTDFVMLGDTISFNITIDESSLPNRVSISDPDRASLTVWFTQRKLRLLYVILVASNTATLISTQMMHSLCSNPHVVQLFVIC